MFFEYCRFSSNCFISFSLQFPGHILRKKKKTVSPKYIVPVAFCHPSPLFHFSGLKSSFQKITSILPPAYVFNVQGTVLCSPSFLKSLVESRPQFRNFPITESIKLMNQRNMQQTNIHTTWMIQNICVFFPLNMIYRSNYLG